VIQHAISPPFFAAYACRHAFDIIIAADDMPLIALPLMLLTRIQRIDDMLLQICRAPRHAAVSVPMPLGWSYVVAAAVTFFSCRHAIISAY